MFATNTRIKGICAEIQADASPLLLSKTRCCDRRRPNYLLLATLDLPIGLSNYQTQEDPDAYDDERTHILYSSSLSLRLGEAEHKIEVRYKRIYNINDQTEYSLQEQINYDISGKVGGFLSNVIAALFSTQKVAVLNV